MSIKLLFFIVLLVGCLTQIAADIYAPAIPAIAMDFNTNLDLVQWTMAIYMFGIAATQMIYGVISEGIGRKGPLLFGLGVIFIGGFICLGAHNIETLLIGRFIQGCGAGATSSMWRSIFRDVFSGHDLAKYGSYLTALIIFIIPAAPILGGYLTSYLNWRYIFVFLILYTIAALLSVLYGYRETSQHHHPERLKIPFIRSTFGELFRNPIFVGSSLTVFMTFGGLFAWITTAPVLLIHIDGMSPVSFGWFLFLGGGSAFTLAAIISGRWVKQIGMANMLRIGWSMMLISGFFLAITTLFLGTNIWAVCSSMVLFTFGSAFIYPNANAIALTPFGKIIGYASSAYGFIQVTGAAIMSGFMSHMHERNSMPIALLTIAASMLAWFCYERVVQKSLNRQMS